MTQALKRRCTAFVLSDFMEREDYTTPLTIANRKHDVVAIQVYDRRIAQLPDVGLMKVYDAESLHEQYIDTSSSYVREAHAAWWRRQQERLEQTLTKCNVDSVSVQTGQDYVTSLKTLFARRTR